MNRYAMTMLVAAVGVSGCAHQQKPDADTLTVRPAPPPPSKEPQLALTQPSATHTGAKEDGQAALEQALAATRVYFDFDEATLNVDGQNSLQQVARVLRAHQALKLQIAGNCDERGTEEYNLMLGQRRAEVARKYLEDLGVPTTQLDTISWGDERPAVEGHDAAAWAKNRRDELAPMND